MILLISQHVPLYSKWLNNNVPHSKIKAYTFQQNIYQITVDPGTT